VTRALAQLLTGAALSLTLVASYLAFGGASYRPAAVADPCQPRTWREPDGIAASVEQIALSTADGAACSLGVSREEVVLALAGRDELAAFAARHGLSERDVEDATREGLRRAVGDAEAAGAVGETTARFLRAAAERLPLGLLLDVLRGASRLLPG